MWREPFRRTALREDVDVAPGAKQRSKYVIYRLYLRDVPDILYLFGNSRIRALEPCQQRLTLAATTSLPSHTMAGGRRRMSKPRG